MVLIDNCSRHLAVYRENDEICGVLLYGIFHGSVFRLIWNCKLDISTAENTYPLFLIGSSQSVSRNEREKRTMHTIAAEKLHELVKEICVAAGADERNAVCLADHQVLSNLRGVDTHGIWHLPLYIDQILCEQLLPTNWPQVIQENSASALVDGNWTFGQTTAKVATEVAVSKACIHGISVVGAVRCNHIGRVGHFVEMAAKKGCIGIVVAGGFSEVDPVTAPFGGRERVLSTNPIAMSFPVDTEKDPVMFDFATTAIAGVKVENALRRGEEVPPGCIIDKDGNPTTDAQAYGEGGAHVPFAEHKGYALNVAVEYLGRILTGSDKYAEENRGTDILRHHGTTVIAIKADLFRPLEDFYKSANEMANRLRKVAPAPGHDVVMAPGDPESQTQAERERDGIPVADDVWKNVVETANKVGVNAES
tara:strand:- start:229 stop:1494 length:1266 start_codon:yes stop_codon:yes gene_type:complete